MGFWGRLDLATKKRSFLLIKQAHQVPPFTDKTSESKIRNKTWAELRSAMGKERNGTWRPHGTLGSLRKTKLKKW